MATRNRFGGLKFRNKRIENEPQEIDNIVENVWDLRANRLPTRPYREHHTSLLLKRHLNDNINLKLHIASDVIQLVQVVRRNAGKSLGGIERAIRQEAPSSLVSNNILAAQNALDLVVRLRLFTTINFDRLNLSLIEAVKDSVSVHRQANKTPVLDMLSEDFSAKSLARKAGIRIVWTSNLPDHLTFATTTGLHVFRHTTVLKNYSEAAER